MQSETIPKSEEFSQAIQTGNREDVLSFCNDKSTKIKGDDGETWKFLSMMFSQDAKRELINHLGFEDVLPKDTPQEVAQETGNCKLHKTVLFLSTMNKISCTKMKK